MDSDPPNLENTKVPLKPPDNLTPSNPSRDQTNMGNPIDSIPTTYKEKLIGNGEQIYLSIDPLSSLTLPMKIQEDESAPFSKEDYENLALSITITLEDNKEYITLGNTL